MSTAKKPSRVSPRSRRVFPIVGVGASAGGLEAFRRLLAALPVHTGMAYVLVQHLDPSHESALATLLAKATGMPVSEVKGDVSVQPDHVYVAPAPRDITLSGGKLKLVERARTHGGQHMPIDSFFRALAGAQGSQAIGVILSGTGSDGTLGLKAIKAKGGNAYAQDAATAAYDGMLQSAIASGCVDFVLPPERIARELASLSRHPGARGSPRPDPARDPRTGASKGKDGLGAILTLLRGATNADFSAYKPATIRRRIARRMALLHLDTVAEYTRHLESHPDELRALYHDCLITVTSFFRDKETFGLLCKTVLPRLLKQRAPGATVRIWVPGCSTGEEVYSIVICLLETAGEADSNLTLQVFGTDLSESTLEKARAGRYPESIVQDVSPERLRRFFTKVEGRYQVNKAVRDMCVFARHDLTRDPPFSRMDLVSCRNVLIYLEPRQQKRVLAVLHYALQPSGFVLLGASESTATSGDLFAPVDKRHRIYSKRPGASALAIARTAPIRGEPDASPGPSKPHTREDRLDEADRLLLARYAPAGVVLDAQDAIVEFRGETDPYLEHPQGPASLNVFRMARKGLLFDLREAIQQARKRGVPYRKENAWVRYRGQVRRLDIEVVPLRGSQRSLLVVFDARSEAKGARPDPALPSAAGRKENATLKLALANASRQLQAVMQEHEAANEELQASSEEVLSANEELQSVNEELEAAKEELQASNEELTTLNQEINERNLQLEVALDHTNAIVETVRTPLLLLESDMRVRRANRAFYDHFDVPPEDTIGKPVFELGNGQWNIPALREALEQILPRAMHIADFEVRHTFPRIGPRTMLLNARQLRHSRDRASILVVIEDRTDANKLDHDREALLDVERQARMHAEQADRIKDEFVATVSHELRGPLNAIMGWIDVLRADDLDEATRSHGLAALERSAGAQARMVEELLDYSRIVGGKLQLIPRLINVVSVAEAAADSIRTAADAKGIRLKLVSHASPSMIHGDADRMQQVIWNLLSNAVKFTPREGRIEVWIGRVDKSLLVRVADTGQGIPRHFLPYVFERFRQAEATPSRRQAGLGLGLAIARELVELHGGEIQGESPGEGLGSTFTVTLPIPALQETKPATAEPRNVAAKAQPAATGAPPTLEGVRVLVVEDESDSREMLAMVFERCGATVTAAASAGDARTALERATVDVLVCDIGLPGEDGYAFMRKLRAGEDANAGRVPAIALTAYTGASDIRRAIAAGFDLHVAKPASPVDLVASVASLARAAPGR